MKDIISNCFLCEEHSLHVAGTEEAQVMQCINCGYVTSTKYTGTKEAIEDEDKMKWSFAPMVEIPEGERKDYPNGSGGFYDKKVDTDNPKVYNKFITGMSYINEMLKQRSKIGE